MAGSVVIQSFCLASTVVQLDRFVARIQPLAILPPLGAMAVLLINFLRNLNGKK